MFDNFEMISWNVSLLIIIISSLVLGTILMILLRPLVRPTQKNQEAILSGIGFLAFVFTFLIGYAIFICQNRYTQAENAVDAETGLIRLAFLDSKDLSPPHRDEVQQALKDYVRYVVEKEWNLLIHEDENIDKMAEPYLERVWDLYQQVPVVTEKDKVWYSIFMHGFDELMNKRQLRLGFKTASIHPLIWVLIIFSGAMIILFIFLYDHSSNYYNFIINYIFILTVVLPIFLILALDYPFKGEIRVKPTAFEKLMEI